MPQTRPEVSRARRELARRLGRSLAEARVNAGLSQAAAAAALGLAQSAIAKLERGDRVLSLLEGLDLAQLYGLAPTALDPRREAGPARTSPSIKPGKRGPSEGSS